MPCRNRYTFLNSKMAGADSNTRCFSEKVCLAFDRRPKKILPFSQKGLGTPYSTAVPLDLVLMTNNHICQPFAKFSERRHFRKMYRAFGFSVGFDIESGYWSPSE